MLILILFLDFIILAICILAAWVTYCLWCMLGKRGLVTWLVYAMGYAILLRLLSVLSDAGYSWGIVSYTRVLALPMYLFLLLGLWGMYQQVASKLKVIKPLPLVKKVKVHIDSVEVDTAESTIKVPGKTVLLDTTKKNGKK
jgi:hypothetical protein